MTSQRVKNINLPDNPGIYIFRDGRKRPLYIGRATSLRDRVRSYFARDIIVTRGPRIIDMVTKASTVTWQETDSVLEAVLLESELIKRYQPFYNVGERDDKSSQYVIITDEEWPRVFLVRARDFDQAIKAGTSPTIGGRPYKVRNRFGPYPHSGLIAEALKILRRLFPFKDKKSFDPRHDAFYRALGRSPLADDDTARRRYMRTIDYLTLFFQGKKQQLRTRLEKQMKAYSRQLRFEECSRIKKLLYALDHINDIALIKEDRRTMSENPRIFRMEAYDIAHLSGMETVGVMVVSENGDRAPAEYRKFKLSRNANDDVAGLMEILSRRLDHPEWTYPDMIIVDGNRVQASHAEVVLKARRMNIPVVAVTKDDRHKASKIIGDPELVGKYEKQVISLNAESHRFAISFHRQRRGKRFI